MKERMKWEVHRMAIVLISYFLLQSPAQAGSPLIIEPNTVPPMVPESATPQAEPSTVPAPHLEPNLASPAVQITDKSLANGIYLIVRQSPDKSCLGESSKNEHLVIYDERELEGDGKADVTYFVVQKQPFIPMILGSDPTKGIDTKGRTMLQLQLAEDQVKNLENFTRKNVNKGVAVIIGGTVVSSHKIRVPIVGGKLQITRCTDNRCETIYTELVKARK